MNKNKHSIWKIIWIIGIYLTLVLILYLVVLYKVKWEDADLNKYLYFYNCSNELCTSENKVDNYYNYLKCENEICPTITEKKDNLVILNHNKDYLYDYIDNKIINDTYNIYHFTNSNYLIATNSEKLQGIIDYTGQVIMDFKYNNIINYNDGFITYQFNDKIGIANVTNSINIEPKYDDAIIINAQIYAYYDTDGYYIASYESQTPISNTIYDYIYSENGIIFTIKDNKIDILDTTLRSKLLIQIDTYYSYKIEKERNTLNIYTKDNLLHFTLYNENKEYTKYIYDINNNKIYS